MYYKIREILLTPYWEFKRNNMDKKRQNNIMIYDPSYINDEQIEKWEIPFKRGESVLYLFEIKNMGGHCAVVDKAGRVHWGHHIEDFRVPEDSEI